MIEVTNGVSLFDHSPFVHIKWGTEKGQLTPDEARAFALSIIAAAECAESDAALFRVMSEMDATPEGVGVMLHHVRNARADKAWEAKQ